MASLGFSAGFSPVPTSPASAAPTAPPAVTAARGFRAAGVCCGIRPDRADLALVVSDQPASAAAVFTRNLAQAAPIVISREHLAASGGRARALVINAGNANACTGLRGLHAARVTAEAAALCLGFADEEVLVASTGVIGQQLPVGRILSGLPIAVQALSIAGGSDAATAILTTDLCTKQAVRVVTTPLGCYTLGGMAKGSGMIHPDMATTLAFVTTDAAVDPAVLQQCLSTATERSFNRITVDGDTSTNDTIAILANGASGVTVEDDRVPAFQAALTDLLTELARMVARDGEGATRLITVTVSGAESEGAALAVARTIAGSPLVKTAVHGADANWGRIIAAACRAGVAVDPERMRITLGGVCVLAPGLVSEFSKADAKLALESEEVAIGVDLGQGPATATTWTCDLTAGYIAINANYRS